MCTAATFKNKDIYFGRTLDYEFSYGEKVVITPRNYEFNFRHLGINKSHYAIIGMAHVDHNYPMYYDAMNERGLGIAGLNFAGNAYFPKPLETQENVAQFEFIPYILANYVSVSEVKDVLHNINVVDTPYNEYFPASPLHYIIRDLEECIVVEFMKDGMHIYDNKTGCMTNNPPFNYQLDNLKKYSYLSNAEKDKTFSFDNSFYSRGEGSLGLPGDLTSASRFVRVVFTSQFSKSNQDEISSVNQFFHILGSVCQTNGLCKIKDAYEYTIYTSCMNLNKGIYYYQTYNNFSINAINLYNVNLDSDNLITYDLLKEEFNKQN